jgi:CDP-6-deoxy-D-xylo-4-hexulose-3-dehydrase
MVGLQATRYAGRIRRTNVLVPALTFISTANAVKLTGMEMVFGDINKDTFHLHPWNILRSHQEIEIGLVLPVHLFGYAANMPAILERVAWTLDQPVLAEDACEAHGTTIDDQLVGTFGLWSAFSFYIAHIVQAGELGCLCTNDDEIAAIARSIKVHGRACDCKICTRNESYCPHLDSGDPRFTFNYIGYNFKPMEFQAALARVQMRHLEENFEKRRANFALLKDFLQVLKGHINPIYEQPGMVPFAMPIILQKEGIRDKVVAQLEQNGVEARPLFGCIPTQQPAYAEYREKYLGNLPVAEYYGANGLYVGCHQYLTAYDIARMGQIIISIVKGLS